MSSPDESRLETKELIRRSAEGDSQALQGLFARHRQRLVRMVRARLDWRLQSRIDPEDVIQEVLAQASRRLPSYLRDPKMPFFLWLRFLTRQQLADLNRQHLGAKARDVRREVPLLHRPLPEATSQVIAAQLLGTWTTPSRNLIRAELRLRVQEALENLEPRDREVLVLRHYESLTNSEIAHELGLEEPAASKRYFRALNRIKRALLAQSPPGKERAIWEEGTS